MSICIFLNQLPRDADRGGVSINSTYLFKPMNSKFFFVFFSLILCFACFHAPSPSYLRPGHPEWPVGWVRDMAFDSLINQYANLKELGITCAGMKWKETAGREREIVRFCRNRGMKIYLTGYLDSLAGNDYQSLNDPETIHAITIRLQKVLSAWTTEDGNFPVDLIPGIQINASFRIPVPDTQANQNAQPTGSETGFRHRSLRDSRILQQIVDHLVPGLLVLLSTGESDSPPEFTDTGVMTLVFFPCIDSFPSEKLQVLQRRRASWRRNGILCIPEIRESVLLDADRLPTGSDSLFHQLRLITPDAVVWEQSNGWPDSWQKRIEAFHHFLRIQ
jgi:hypothetical protein